ncbi:MAG: DUF3168 domain-containing protein [Beijerinckiaceae bacterium]
MTHPSHALIAVLIARLRADTALLTLLGGPHIYEQVPADRKPPWVIVEEVTARDNGTSLDQGHIHRLTLACVSAMPGITQCAEIAARAAALLDNAALLPDGHRLVNCAVTETALRRSDKRQRRIMAVRLRAVTEVL